MKRDERTVRRWEKEGLPVRRKVHKKQASVFAYRPEIDAWWNSGRQRLESIERPAPRRRLMQWLLIGLLGASVVAFATLKASNLRRVRWARNQALPEISRLLDQDKSDAAFRLARQAERYIPDDPLLDRLLRSFTASVSIQTTPPGADIYVKRYSAEGEEQTYLGQSPLENIRIPWDYLHWRIVKPGFGTVEAASSVVPNMSLRFLLDDAQGIPVGMVRVPGGTFQFRSAPTVELAPYWLDKYEVMNRQFKEFIERVATKIATTGRTNSFKTAAVCLGKTRRLSFAIPPVDPGLPHGSWDPSRKVNPISR